VRAKWSRRVRVRVLYWSVVVKRELSRKVKLSIYRSISVPTLTYGHKLWVVTERTRLWIQLAKMSFLHRVAGLSLRDRTCWRDYISHLAWERLGISQEERETVAEEKEAWGPLFSRLPPRPGPGLAEEDGWMEWKT